MTRKTCVALGCGRPFDPEPHDGGRCEAHRLDPNRHSDPDRGSAAQRRIRLEVFERDGYRCHWCGCALQRHKDGLGREPHADHHPIPRSAGGKFVPGNLVASCRPCNQARGNRGGAPA